MKDPFGKLGLAVAGSASKPEQRHHRGEAQHAIEIGAADTYAAVGENNGKAIGLAGSLRRYAHDRKIRRAASDVDDEHQLLFLHLELIVERRRDRLILKFDVAKPDRPRRRLQIVLSLLIGGRVGLA